MHLIARILLLAAPALATIPASTTRTTLTHVGCSTRVACTPHVGPVRTITVGRTVHETCIQHQVTTTTPVTTVPGPPTTTTLTSTSTTTTTVTIPTSTDTYTSTTTVDSTSTTTVATITETVTDDSGVTVTSTSTSTITQPTPAGYTGAPDSTGEQNAPSQQKNKKKKRSRVNDQPLVDREKLEAAKGAGGALPLAYQRYPQQVLCTTTLETEVTIYSTRTAPTSTVTGPGPTITTTAIITSTSTSTLAPSATVTVTVTDTSTITSSVTETDTSTTFITDTATVTTTTTFYAACATNYLLGPNLADGTGVDNFDPTNGDFEDMLVSTADSGYDCCVACMTSSDVCYASWYGGGTCYSIINDDPSGPGGVCSPSYEYGILENFSGSGEYIVANGPCGQLGPS